VGRTLDRIVMRALRRDPKQRFSSAGEMCADLEGYLQRTRAPGGAVRAFMTELSGSGRPSPTPPPGAAPGTIMLDEAELMATADAPSGGAEAPREPDPPRARASGAAGGSWRKLLANRRRRLVVGLLASLALVVAGRGLHLRRATVEAIAPATAAAAATPPPPPAPRAPETVEIVLDSVPQGATVTVEGRGLAVGQTPLVLELPRGRAPVTIWLRRDGHDPLPYKIIPSQSHPVTIELPRRRGAR
jgi:PEGA domain